MESNNLGRAYDWNDTIGVEEQGSEYVVLPEGDYNFVVKSFERGRHEGSEKLPPCNKAVLSIEVSDGTNRTTIRHNLFLHSKCAGMLCEFFGAIGQHKHGEQLRMDWSRVVGSSGRCKVIVDSFTSRKTGEILKNNKIRRFYEPAAQAAAHAGFTPDSTAPSPDSIFKEPPQQASFFGSGKGSFNMNRGNHA